MTCCFCYEKSLFIPKEDYFCKHCNHYYTTKPVRRFCEFCRWRKGTLPIPRTNLCSACGKKYPDIEIPIGKDAKKRTELTIDDFLGDEE